VDIITEGFFAVIKVGGLLLVVFVAVKIFRSILS
jgi:hypothetical protein